MYSVSMEIFGKPLEKVVESDLSELLGRKENKYLEFKSQTYGSESQHKVELCADISAFANTVGGLIIIGVEEKKGEAVKVDGITIDNCDKEKLRLEQVARAGLSPNIGGLHIHSIGLTSGKHVIFIEIPKSYNSPHRVESNNDHRFYLRGSGGKYQPDVDELRKAFTGLEMIHQRMTDFRYERIAKIAAGDTPLKIMDSSSSLVMHIIPYTAFSRSNFIDVQLIRKNLTNFRPMYVTQHNVGSKVNFEGVVTYPASRSEPTSAYTHVWRRGIIEAVRCNLVQRDKEIPYTSLEYIRRNILDGMQQYFMALKEVEVFPPFAVFVTLVGVKNAKLWKGAYSVNDIYPNLFDRDHVYTSEIIIEDFIDDQKLYDIMAPAFDEIAYAAGFWGA